MQMELEISTLSAEGSLAKICRKPASGLELTAHEAGFGWNTSVSLTKFDRVSSLWKTSQTCFRALEGDGGNGLAEYLETWPCSGLMHGGVVYELAILERPISEIGFGLLPTPRASKRGARRPETAIESLRRRGRSKPHKLEDALVILEGKTGIPNPQYVEWMQGLPKMWTGLEP